MIKLLVFDFDGTLADTREIHYQSLNRALENIDPKFVISYEESIKKYDGLSVSNQLKLLVKEKGLLPEYIPDVYNAAQKYTMDIINESLNIDTNLVSVLSSFKKEGYTIYVASNSVRDTIITGLYKLGVLHLFDKVFSNQDVQNTKPHPEIYLKCILDAGVKPKETLIIEDSKTGRLAALESGAFVCGVDNPKDLSYEKIKDRIKYSEQSSIKFKWVGHDTNILIPMAGAGARFSAEGYTKPKPLIDVDGKPMIQLVVENLNIDANFIFLVQKQHYDNFNLGVVLPLISPGCKVITVDGLTEGTACTALLAKEFINNDKHLLISNADQFIEWDSNDFMYSSISDNIDGNILTFKSNGNKWSYVKTDEYNNVIETAEKKEISDQATTGIYYFHRGSDFVKYAEKMINEDIRVNNEFYICPVYNQFIQDGKKIKAKNCKRMWNLGTPEDLKYYLDNYEK